MGKAVHGAGEHGNAEEMGTQWGGCAHEGKDAGDVGTHQGGSACTPQGLRARSEPGQDTCFHGRAY